MRIYILILFVLFTASSIAQSITYEYDNAGERILRKQNVPLPVTLISFTATKVPEGSPEGFTALLNWQTSSEINSDRFDIERSQDGKKWSNIGNVAADGEKASNTNYSFTDKIPTDGENLYRLKMVDKDGTFAYSRIQSLDFGSSIVFFPNPVKGWLKVKGVASGKFQLLNASGNTIQYSNHIPAEGIDMNGLSSGIYVVRIIHDDGSLITKKVVKQ